MSARFEAICLVLFGFVLGFAVAFDVWHDDLRSTLRKGAAPTEDVFISAPADSDQVLRWKAAR